MKVLYKGMRTYIFGSDNEISDKALIICQYLSKIRTRLSDSLCSTIDLNHTHFHLFIIKSNT